MPNTKITTKFNKFKEHKGTIRYQASSSTNQDGQSVDNPIRDIYVDRAFSNGKSQITMTLE